MERRDFLKGLIGIIGGVYAGRARADGENEEGYFSANYFRGDENGNKLMDTSEFDGFDKRVFGKDEKVCFCANVRGREGKKLTFRLLDEKGRAVKEQGDVIPNKKWSLYYPFEAGELGPGTYTAVWKYGGLFGSEIKLVIEVKDASAATLKENLRSRQMEDLLRAIKETREEFEAQLGKRKEDGVKK